MPNGTKSCQNAQQRYAFAVFLPLYVNRGSSQYWPSVSRVLHRFLDSDDNLYHNNTVQALLYAVRPVDSLNLTVVQLLGYMFNWALFGALSVQFCELVPQLLFNLPREFPARHICYLLSK